MDTWERGKGYEKCMRSEMTARRVQSLQGTIAGVKVQSVHGSGLEHIAYD